MSSLKLDDQEISTSTNDLEINANLIQEETGSY